MTTLQLMMSLVSFSFLKSRKLDTTCCYQGNCATMRVKCKVHLGRHKDKEKVSTFICGAVHFLQVKAMECWLQMHIHTLTHT